MKKLSELSTLLAGAIRILDDKNEGSPVARIAKTKPLLEQVNKALSSLVPQPVVITNSYWIDKNTQAFYPYFEIDFKDRNKEYINYFIERFSLILLVLSEHAHPLGITAISTKITEQRGKFIGTIERSVNELHIAGLIGLSPSKESPKKRYFITDEGRKVLAKLTFE